MELYSTVRHPKSKTQALSDRNNEGEKIVYIDSGEILREYNWGVTTILTTPVYIYIST